MKLIFDVGFNHGEFTDACFKKFPNTQVVAIEANPNLCTKDSNDNFALINRLVSDKDDEEIDFFIEHNADGISTASPEFMSNSRFTKGSKYITTTNNHNWSNAVKIPSITLDNLIEYYGTPDLIKVDVEGYEYTVLKGLTKQAKDICFEYHEEMDEEIFKIVVGMVVSAKPVLQNHMFCQSNRVKQTKLRKCKCFKTEHFLCLR